MRFVAKAMAEALAICLAAHAFAGAAATGEGAGAGPSDPREVEQFLDSLMPEQMPRCHAPGAVVVLVKDCRTFLAKGYGYADVEQRRPVEAERTLFRVHSVSKAVTATAAMQLVERGRLSLTGDVNAELGRAVIPTTFAQPITLPQLLTHTSGLDDRYLCRRAQHPAELLPLDQYLTHNLPPRLTPPGEIVRYSNHNLILTGYLIEAASGRPFARCVQEQVFEPLEMRHSSFVETPELAADLAVGYAFTAGAYRRRFYHAECNPAGSMIGTGTDMAHFMIAHLQGGRWGDRQVLKPETARQMQSRQFTLDPRVPGVCLGFWERSINGQRTIEHAGNATGFISVMLLIPERNLGLFVSVNCEGEAGELIGVVLSAFFDRYFPYAPPAAAGATLASTPPPDRQLVSRLAGTYRPNSVPATGIEKLLLLAGHGREVRVTLDAAGMTLAAGPSGRQRRTYVRESPLLYRETSGSGHLAFKQDAKGRWLLVGGPYGVLERLAAYETFAFQIVWLLACLLVLLSFVIVWPAVWIWKRARRARGAGAVTPPPLPPAPAMRPKASRWALGAAAVASGLILLVVVSSALALRGSLDADFGTGGAPLRLKAILLLPPLAAAISPALIGFTALAWRRSTWTLPARLHYTAMTVAAVAMIFWFEHWNILRWWFVRS